MSLYEKIKEVLNIFEELDKIIIKIKKEQNIDCIDGCGTCCMKENIEATILEFLPAANYLINNGNIDYYYKKTKESKYCVFFNPLKTGGKCELYKYRGLICRLFGFSARKNKYNKLEPITCNILKNNITKKFDDFPLIHDYYLRLSTIDPALFSPFYNINKAIQKSIEIVSLYHHFKKVV